MMPPSRLDRLILGGHDPDEPVPRLYFERAKWALIAALFIAILGTGGTLTLYQHDRTAALRHLATDCVDRPGDLAARHFWERNQQIYSWLAARRISMAEAQRLLVANNNRALTEAGPIPECIIPAGPGP